MFHAAHSCGLVPIFLAICKECRQKRPTVMVRALDAPQPRRESCPLIQSCDLDACGRTEFAAGSASSLSARSRTIAVA